MRRCIRINEEQCFQLNELWDRCIDKEITADEMFSSTDEILGTKLNYERVKFKSYRPFTNILVMQELTSLWDMFIEKRERQIDPNLAKMNRILNDMNKLWRIFFLNFIPYLMSCYLLSLSRTSVFVIINKLFWCVCLFFLLCQFVNWLNYYHIYREDKKTVFARLFEKDDDEDKFGE